MGTHHAKLVPGSRQMRTRRRQQPFGFVALMSGIGTLAIIVLLAAGVVDAMRRRYFV